MTIEELCDKFKADLLTLIAGEESGEQADEGPTDEVRDRMIKRAP